MDNLPRWLKQSVTKHLLDRLTGIPILIDGVGDTGDAIRWLELFFHGPTRIQHSKLYTLYYLDVLVGCQVRVTDDVFAIADLQGRLISALKVDVQIYRLGPTEDSANDGSFVGCLKLRDDVANPIDGVSFGIVTDQIRRETVEAQLVFDSQEE